MIFIQNIYFFWKTVRIGGGQLVGEITDFAVKVKQLERQEKDYQEALTDPPDEFLDPIMSTLMTGKFMSFNSNDIFMFLTVEITLWWTQFFSHLFRSSYTAKFPCYCRSNNDFASFIEWSIRSIQSFTTYNGSSKKRCGA